MRAQVEQGHQDASDTGCPHSDEEGPAQSKIDTEDGGLGDTEERGDTTGSCKPLHLGVTGLEEHGQGYGTLSDIRHGGDREDEGPTGTGLVSDERQLYRGEGLVKTGDHDRGVDDAEEEATHGACRVVQPVQTVRDPDRQLTGERSDDDEGEEPGHQHGEQRCQQEVSGSR